MPAHHAQDLPVRGKAEGEREVQVDGQADQLTLHVIPPLETAEVGGNHLEAGPRAQEAGDDGWRRPAGWLEEPVIAGVQQHDQSQFAAGAPDRIQARIIRCKGLVFRVELDALEAERLHAAQFARDVGKIRVHGAEGDHRPAVLPCGPRIDRDDLVGARGHRGIQAGGNAGAGQGAQQAGAGAVVARRIGQGRSQLCHHTRGNRVREDVGVAVENWAGGFHVRLTINAEAATGKSEEPGVKNQGASQR